MVSVYRTLDATSFQLYLLRHTTLSATDFVMEADELLFKDQDQRLGVLKAFGDNPKLNKMFAANYAEMKKKYHGPWNGTAHFGLMLSALTQTIEANRKLFPPDEIAMSIDLGNGLVSPLPAISSVYAMAGKLFRQEQGQRVADSEMSLEELQAQRDAREATPDDPARKAFEILLSIILLQRKDKEQEQDGDPMAVILNDVLKQGTTASTATQTETQDAVSDAQKASAQTLIHAIVKGSAADIEAAIKAYAAF